MKAPRKARTLKIHTITNNFESCSSHNFNAIQQRRRWNDGQITGKTVRSLNHGIMAFQRGLCAHLDMCEMCMPWMASSHHIRTLTHFAHTMNQGHTKHKILYTYTFIEFIKFIELWKSCAALLYLWNGKSNFYSNSFCLSCVRFGSVRFGSILFHSILFRSVP